VVPAAHNANFLPLTLAASDTLTCLPLDGSGEAAYGYLDAVRAAAAAADEAAAACWLTLLAACDAPGRVELPVRLQELAEATSRHTGREWWFSDDSTHRRRVADAQLRIEDAVREGDGEEFAEAFAGYDQAVARAVVCSPRVAHRGAAVPPARHPDDGAAVSHSR
jgi:hypothetical protein